MTQLHDHIIYANCKLYRDFWSSPVDRLDKTASHANCETSCSLNALMTWQLTIPYILYSPKKH